MAEWRWSRNPLCSPGAGSNPGKVLQCRRYDRRRPTTISMLSRFINQRYQSRSSLVHKARTHLLWTQEVLLRVRIWQKVLIKGGMPAFIYVLSIQYIAFINGNHHEGLTDCLISLRRTCKHARAWSSFCDQKKKTNPEGHFCSLSTPKQLSNVFRCVSLVNLSWHIVWICSDRTALWFDSGSRPPPTEEHMGPWK